MDTLRALSLSGDVVLTGLMAGIYLAFSIAVMPGIARHDDETYVGAMRGMNAAILNPVFFLVFVGPLVLGVAAVLTRIGEGTGLVRCALALGMYVVTLVLTATVNVPLNNRLDGTEPASAARALFEARWVTWNGVRAVASVASFAVLVWALAGE